jgi:hypothetical protein
MAMHPARTGLVIALPQLIRSVLKRPANRTKTVISMLAEWH